MITLCRSQHSHVHRQGYRGVGLLVRGVRGGGAPAKAARYRQVVFRSPDDLPEEEPQGDGGNPHGKIMPRPQELEFAVGQPKRMEQAEDSPAAAVVANSRNHCQALGCSYEGDNEARITHWRGSHLPELPLWLCPVGRCNHKCRDREALLNHLRGKRHK